MCTSTCSLRPDCRAADGRLRGAVPPWRPYRQLDVTDRDAAFAAVKAATDKFGQLDVVVNNAGYGLFGTVEEITEQQLRDQLEVNLFGVFHVTQAVLAVLRAQGSGHIIQISTIGGVAAFPLGGYHDAQPAFESSVLGPMTAVHHAIVAMRFQMNGTIVFINGGTAVTPAPTSQAHPSPSPAKAPTARRYTTN